VFYFLILPKCFFDSNCYHVSLSAKPESFENLTYLVFIKFFQSNKLIAIEYTSEEMSIFKGLMVIHMNCRIETYMGPRKEFTIFYKKTPKRSL
jgi:hypothetical protein